MNSVLGRYLMLLLLKRTLATVLILTGLLQIVDLFDTTTDIIERGLGVAGIIKYEMLRAPGMIQQILPVSVLIGALTTFTGLARNSEMAALRSTGITIYRIILMLLPAAALIAVVHFFIADQIAPRSAQALSVWWKSTAPAEEQAKPAKQRQVWFRTPGYLVFAEGASADGRTIQKLRIYRREQGRLVERITADTARVDAEGTWRLRGASTLQVGTTQVARPVVGERPWAPQL